MDSSGICRVGRAVVGGLAALAVALAVALGAGVAMAQEDGDSGGDSGGVSGMVGLGAGWGPEHEGSNEYRPIPIFVARLRLPGRYTIGTDGDGFLANITGSRFIEAGPALGFRLQRADNIDDAVVARLPDVDRAIEAGAFVKINLPFPVSELRRDALTLGALFLQDVSGAHDGYTITTTLRYRGMIKDRLVVRAGPFATYASGSFMDTYYTVTPGGSARSGLPAFRAENGWKDYGVSATARYSLTDSWALIGTMNHRRYVGDARDSPIVSVRGNDGVWFFGTALVYMF